MSNTETLHKEIDLLQDLIKEMRKSSFQVKAWFISIFGAIIVFSKTEIGGGESTTIFPVWVIPVLLLIVTFVFWYLDAFFLHAEKRTRVIYEWVISNRPTSDKYQFDLKTLKRDVNGEEKNIAENVKSVQYVMGNITLLPFYCLPFIFALFLTVKFAFLA